MALTAESGLWSLEAPRSVVQSAPAGVAIDGRAVDRATAIRANMTNTADVRGVRGGRRTWSAAVAMLLTVLAVAGTLFGVTAAPAAADTAPWAPGEPATVSADALPTVQINGVVWDQVIIGNRVYATGSFTQARPAGAAAGTEPDGSQQRSRLRHHHRQPDHELGPQPQPAGPRHHRLA